MLFGSKQPVVGKASTLVNKPPEAVFEYIGEGFLSNYPKWSPEVVDLKPLSDGPVTVGTMAKQVRVDHGHKSESTFKVSDFERNRIIRFCGVSKPFRCTYELEAASNAPAATRLAFTFELSELEPFLRPFEKLVRIAIQDGADRTVKNLKGLLESRPDSNAA